jgi:hypothetical protein
MIIKNLEIKILFLLISLVWTESHGQSVTAGIHYQAVARDNAGKELYNKGIVVKFSIISGTPIGEVVYQELHSQVTTSKYGVFSLVIGKGTPTGGIYGRLSEVDWSRADHYLKVEVKFDNSFIDMGTMQFLAVPYALYAQKSLEPGPAGPKGDTGQKGDPGDPASDDQNLSFDQSNLSISGGNSVPLTSLLQNLTITNTAEGNYLGISRGNSVLLATIEADGDPTNEIQDLVYDAVNRQLKLLKSTAPAIDLTELKNDADADPFNEIQDLNLTGNTLTITNKISPTAINLAPYLDNTDNQMLTYTPNTNTLSLTNGGSVSLGSMVAFRAKKNMVTTGSIDSNVDFIPSEIEYNDGSNFEPLTSEFTAPSTGIYTFDLEYIAPSNGAGQMIMIYKNGILYEILESNINNGSKLVRTANLKLVTGNKIKFVIYTAISTSIGTGSFSGYKVY